MSRILSPQGTESLQALTTGEAWLTLLQITGVTNLPGGGQITETFSLVNNLAAITSSLPGSATEFLPYAFNLTLADTETQTTPTAKVIIDNVDVMLVDMLRSVDERPSVDIWIVLSSQPNIAEIHLQAMKLHGVSITEKQISGTLSVENHLTQKFPSRGGMYDPKQFPGMF